MEVILSRDSAQAKYIHKVSAPFFVSNLQSQCRNLSIVTSTRCSCIIPSQDSDKFGAQWNCGIPKNFLFHPSMEQWKKNPQLHDRDVLCDETLTLDSTIVDIDGSSLRTVTESSIQWFESEFRTMRTWTSTDIDCTQSREDRVTITWKQSRAVTG